MADIELERIMFERPPEWGNRVINRDNEILLQRTNDGGKTWVDMPIPDAKLTLVEDLTRTRSTNIYSGLKVEKTNSNRRSISTANQELNPAVQDAIDSGHLLNKLITKGERGEDIETVTFIGAFPRNGLYPGQLWRDSENYLRIVPD